MARNEETRRVQFTLPAALVDAIDELCDVQKMQRSTWVEYTLASAISTQKQVMAGVVEGLSQKMMDSVGEDSVGE